MRKTQQHVPVSPHPRITATMHSLPVHFFISCSLSLLLACASNAAPLVLTPTGIQIGATKIGDAQFISVAVPINGFTIQVSAVDAAAPTSIVNVPMVETASAENGAWFPQVNPQLHSKLRLPTTTPFSRQVDPSVNGQLEAHRSSQKHSSPNFRVHSSNYIAVNEATPVPQVEGKIPNSNGCVSQVGPNGGKSISMANGNVNIVGQSLSCS
ncbi:unnamed protein product [Adineta ricciae]|uniref:Uncharacterized protein n=1 Tax=Adineta ricciae TaxID=249248 RepID=A0A815JUJ9_ADIRI|nr:unnamed protein product [Adineta ricciae]